MSFAAGDLEATLCQAYREQAVLYDRVLSLADSLTASLHRGEDVTGSLSQVMALLGEAAAVEARMGPSRKLWEDKHAPAGPELTAVVAEVRAQVERLAQWVAEAEGEAKAQQEQLVPQIDALLRIQERQRAYRSAQIRSQRGI